MLPPIDDQVLQDNPGFASLYSTLVRAILAPDGSTQHDPAAEARAAVREELDRRRREAARLHLLERAVATASPPASPPPSKLGQPRPRRRLPAAAVGDAARGAAALPEPLLDLLLVLPPLLEAGGSLAPESAAVLLSSPPLSEDLEALLPDLAALLSSKLHSSALSLARIFHPTTNPSYIHRHIPSLPKHHAALADSLAVAQQNLAALRLHALASLAQLSRCYTQSLTHLVRSLEAKHGVVARSLELRASQVSLQAQRTEMQASDTLCSLTRELYSPQAVAALQAYAQHLMEATARVAQRTRSLQAKLGEYGVGAEGTEVREKTMRDMAKLYREMHRQVGDVEKDLDRLRGG